MKKAFVAATINQEEISSYLKDVRKYNVLTNEEEKELLKELILLKENPDPGKKRLIANKLIESNLRFVISIAKEYQGKGLDLNDLIAEGNTGLIKAFDNFDPTKQNKFISYAVWWVRQSIFQALNDKARIIRLPSNIVQEQAKQRKVVKDEIEMFLDECCNDYPTTLKLDQEIDEEGTTLIELIANPDAIPPDQIMENKERIKNEINGLLNNLDNRERTIIEDYYGLSGTQKTLEEIGEDLSLTRERIRQIRDRALKQLRDNSQPLFEYL